MLATQLSLLYEFWALEFSYWFLKNSCNYSQGIILILCPVAHW